MLWIYVGKWRFLSTHCFSDFLEYFSEKYFNMALFIIANKSLALKEDNKDLFREAMDKKKLLSSVL